MWTRAAFAALAMAGAAAAAENRPDAAGLDWLSDSITLPEDDGELAPPEPVPFEVSRNALPLPVTVAPLDAPLPDRIGLAAPMLDGLGGPLWSAAPVEPVRDALSDLRAPELAVTQALARDLLVAAADPPRGSDGRTMFLARVDALLSVGALAPARELLALSQPDDPLSFRRWLDIAILTGRENIACTRMRTLPEITPTLTARIFCLARTGDWPAAALTLDTAIALDAIDRDEAERMFRFLDDFSDGPALPLPNRPTPLDYAIHEAIGEPLPAGRLPLAFVHADLRGNVGWKARIEATERLARAGALPTAQLWRVYGEREPAASGGLWDRVAALQEFEAALAEGNAQRVSALLPPLWDAMSEARLAAVFAGHRADELARLDLSGAAARIAWQAGLVADADTDTDTDVADASVPPGIDPFLAGLARGEPALARTGFERAVASGMTDATPPTEVRRLIDRRRYGEAVLVAIDRLDDGAQGNLDAVADGLAILRATGLSYVARRAALEIAATRMTR